MVSLGFRDGSQYERRSDTTTSLVGVRDGGVRAGGLLGTWAVGRWLVNLACVRVLRDGSWRRATSGLLGTWAVG